MRDARGWCRKVVATTTVLAAALLAARPVSAQSRALSYATSVADSDGTSRQLSFSGTLDGATMSGTLRVDQMQVVVTGAVTKSGIGGRFDWPTGGKAGEFDGYSDGTDLRGSYNLDGTRGQWKVPLSQVPAEVKGIIADKVVGR